MTKMKYQDFMQQGLFNPLEIKDTTFWPTAKQPKGVAIVCMVHHGGYPGDGGQAQGVFKNWALERFGR